MDDKGFLTSTDFTSAHVTSNNKMHDAPTGSIEHYLNKIKKNTLLVELPKPGFNVLIRDIGLVVRECEQFSQTTTHNYDYLFFFKYVSATKIIEY